MNSIIIVGTGAVSSELTSYIEDQNNNVEENRKLEIKGYLESEENIEKYWKKYKLKKPVLADISSYEIEQGDKFLIGISHLEFRMRAIEVLRGRNAEIIGFTHYTAIIADSAEIGEANIIYPFCIIGPNCKVGNNNLVTSQSMLSHDCNIGNNNFFSSVAISGRVTIGNDNFFGVRSTVIPHITIGSANTIQAGMVVDKDVADGSTVFYKYKEKVIAVPKS